MLEPKTAFAESILCLDELSQEGLIALAEDRIAAVHVHSFIGNELADRLAAWFIGHSKRENYRYSDPSGALTNSDTDRVGVPLSSLYSSLIAPEHDSSSLVERASRDGNVLRAAVRQHCLPHAAPIDTLRLLLDELWPFGAAIARFGSVRPYVGVARIIAPCESPTLALPEPHMDWLPPAISDTKFQCSAIVYLQTPVLGGELDIWNIDDELKGAIVSGRVSMRRSQLGSPLTLKPATGDLIIINTRLPHAVRPPIGGHRVAQTCFFGGSRTGPIAIWS